MKTIFIDDINIGRFGNKIIYLNNLIQLSHKYNLNFYFDDFEHLDIFDIPNNNQTYVKPSEYLTLDKHHFIQNDYIPQDDNILLNHCLGDLFFKYDGINTHKIFNLKEKYKLKIKNKIISLHFRGTDFYGWDNNSILDLNYYIESIKDIGNDIKTSDVYLFTDDYNFDNFINIKKYLDNNLINYSVGNPTDLINDFVIMSQSDIIISSPSTFSISAGFTAEEGKKIYHSKKWVEYQVDKNDLFWIHFYNGGNYNYKKYKLI